MARKIKPAGAWFVEQQYEIESLREELLADEDSSKYVFSLRLSLNTASLLDALSKRFGKSRNAMISEILERVALDSLVVLKPADLERVARDADEFYNSNSGREPQNAFSNLVKIYSSQPTSVVEEGKL